MVRIKDPATTEEPGLIAESIRITVKHLIVAAVSTGTGTGSNAGMHSEVNKADHLEVVTDETLKR